MAASLKDHPVSEIEFAISKALEELNGHGFQIQIKNMQWGFDPERIHKIKIEMDIEAVFEEIPF